MIESEVWDAFSTALTTFAAAQSVPAIHQGTHGVPPDAGSWLESRFFPDTTRNYALADDGPQEHTGFVQITVCGRPGGGLKPALDLAGLAVAAFTKGTKFGRAFVDEVPSISSVLIQPERLALPITIPYKAIVK